MKNKSPFAALERYRPIVDDWDAFIRALSAPLNTSVWTNTLRISTDELVERLQKNNVKVSRLPWYSDGLILEGEKKPGARWEYLLGLYHVQEEVSMIPPLFLDVHPHHRVLDLCSAPGNKTAQIAMMMKNQGTVVANEPDFSRTQATRKTLKRLGLANVSLIHGDAKRLPQGIGPFDRVLADVPCSCEGTSRKNPMVLNTTSAKYCARLGKTQLAILRRGIQVCREDGIIVYSTCTYAPEENEEVIQAVLDEWGPDRLEVLPIPQMNLATTPGIREWNGKTFSPAMQNTIRLWPHHNNTGGFFIAVLKKKAPSTEEAVSPLITSAPPENPEWRSFLQERFGIGAHALSGFDLLQLGRQTAILVSQGYLPPREPKAHTIGLPLFGLDSRLPKLSTAAALLLGRHATKNVVRLNDSEATQYARGIHVPLSEDQRRLCDDHGYVIVLLGEYPLGVGLIDLTQGQASLRSLYPKS